MLLQIKVYLLVVLYFLGAIYMILFPPRNYELSGTTVRTVRSAGFDVLYTEHVDYRMMMELVDRIVQADPDAARRVYLVPHTAHNRSVIALQLRSDRNSRKPGILVIGGLNPMTWGAPNAILNLAIKLLYDPSFQSPFFNDYDWYLIPMANPDGFTFTHQFQSRPPVDPKQWCLNHTIRDETRPGQWHKNIDRQDDNPCIGTNINRNFAYHWQDDVHKTPERCSQFYPGMKPFSTAEGQAIRSYLNQHIADNISLAIHLHASFVKKKEYILYPWRYSLRQQSNHRTLQSIGEYAARHARMSDGRLYEVHQGSNDDRVAGTISDYLAGVIGTDLVYLVKPYFKPFPNNTDVEQLESYMYKSVSVILSLVRGWRSSTKHNTLYFFGRDVEF